LAELKEIIDRYMKKVPEVRKYCDRCLGTRRWDGNVVLMIVDAAFTSIGLNYFKTVVPKVEEFKRKFIDTRRITSLKDLTSMDIEELRNIWKNRRSWEIAKNIASILDKIKEQNNLTDKDAFVLWAKNSKLESWKEDIIGKTKGVGINTYQYLRMMAGIDTVMPDKIVKRVLKEISSEAGEELLFEDDIAFIKEVHKIAEKTGYRPIEICWMTWLVHSESSLSREKGYSEILTKI